MYHMEMGEGTYELIQTVKLEQPLALSYPYPREPLTEVKRKYVIAEPKLPHHR